MLDVEQLAARFDAHHAEIKSLFGENEKALKGVNAIVADLEQKMARRGQHGGGGDIAPSFGSAVIAHPDFETKVAPLANQRGKATLELKTTIMTSATGSGAALVPRDHRDDPVMLARRRLFVRDLIGPGQTDSNAVEYPRQTVGTRNLNAAVVSEGQKKPQSDITFELVTAPVRTIAHFTKASRQLVDDVPMLQSAVDGEMRYGLGLAEEAELLFGDGTGAHVLGIVPQATAYETARNNPANDTRFDTLAHAIAQSIVALLPATGIVMNINDLENLKVIKNTIGNYIGGDAGGPFGPPIRSIWGLPVVGTPVMPANQFLVGAFYDGAQIFDRMGATLMISTENEDDFIRNLATFLVEERLAMTVRRPQAFIYGAFP
jgi:HK97 family phage major capsid protein